MTQCRNRPKVHTSPDPKNNILAHDEAFKKKPVDYKVAYPYYTSDKDSTKPPADGKSVAD